MLQSDDHQLHHMLTNALDANIPGLAEFWIIISHYCIEVLFSLEDFPHVEVFKLIPNVPLRRPFIIVTGYSQNEPWKIFAFNFVPPNLVCLKKNFYAVLSDTSYSQSVSPATKDEIMRTLLTSYQSWLVRTSPIKIYIYVEFRPPSNQHLYLQITTCENCNLFILLCNVA